MRYQERFTLENMAYTQLYLNYLHQKDPAKLKFFDECGLKLPTHGKRNYGHAPIGERCIEFERYAQTANVTVNLMCGLAGVAYMNIIDGGADTLEFFEQAAEAENIYGRPALEVGDIVVMDNCPTHHNLEPGDVLKEFLSNMNIELVYMPAYQGRRSHGGRGGSCPCCPNGAGTARGQQVALFVCLHIL